MTFIFTAIYALKLNNDYASISSFFMNREINILTHNIFLNILKNKKNYLFF